jgi:hypothetical protein
LAADVDDTSVASDATRVRSGVRVSTDIPMSGVVSVHIDEPEASETIAAAVDVWDLAVNGDEDASFLVEDAQACDLLWFDATEIADLVG